MKNTNKKARFLLIISRILAYGFVIFLCFLCLFCFLLLILMASKSNSQMQGAFNFRWGGHFMENLYNAWNDFSINIPVGMVNSFIVAMSSAIITTYFSALTAYGIHVYNFKLKNVVFTFIMAIMMIPSQVSAVGFIQLAYKFGLTNKLWLLIIPSVAAPVVFFYMKQYLESVLPIEMVEAARIDGSNEFRIFNEIVLPIMKPAVAVQMIFSFVSSWNNYFMPALLLTKEKYKTVPIMIANLRSADYSKFDQGKVFMFILLAILPVMIVYTILSKSIIKGVTSGSVKG
ncbi:MAG: carbohydrate ABC transporter permease [Erysipelotrichaceae bacterium]|nr:carbohydrate ABC transporter permease [Erysipelotrichaceae bacterium]MBQ1483190.1 carbohydrate ABC transporter permease [Erysipelotrichaceae bacterium]